MNSKILVFDVETTGTNATSDQVIELCVQFGADIKADVQTWRIKPDVPISPMAEKIHGISADDLRDCPRFPDLAEELWEIFSSSEVLIGYNVEFDISFMSEEFLRVGKPNLDLKNKLLVDPLQIWRKQEPRNLGAAHLRFVGKALENAHSAEGDVRATAAVLEGMKEEFQLVDADWEKLANISGLSRDTWVGPSKHFVFKNSKIVFGFGKHKERSLVEVASEDNGSYLDWILKKDFPEHVKLIIQEATTSSDEELVAWAKEKF
jgi:DNA polymerase-3 subunit epsilon